MKPKSAAILGHIIDSVFLSVLAAIGVWVIWTVVQPYYEKLFIWIVQVRYFVTFVVAISVFWGWLFPTQMMVSVRSLKLWPKHWGLAVRVFVGCIFALILIRLPKLLEIEIKWFILGIIFIEGFLLFVGFCIAKVHLWLHENSRHRIKSQHSDDEPINRLEENLFPEHEISARRILGQLELGKDTEGRGSNVAVIGTYGSGKTSLCNLVKYIYQEEHAQIDDGVLLFCRFEAWQFITADAAVRGLLDEVVNTIEELVDCSGLDKIPEEYLEALQACPGWWFRVIANILKRRRNTEEIMQFLQDVLLRINKRVVVFVDDFDRLESSSRDTQQIIAAALNQLQNLTNVQYVLCVGPMREGAGADLLKLTRFQEQMPEVSSEKVIDRIKVLRDEIITKNESAYYLWSLIEHRSTDPLYYSPMTAFFNAPLSSQLVKLIRTPRQLKAVERETREKWNGGLNGEISWYDLLLISALKVSEPRVFEWIIRESELFLNRGIQIGEPTEEEKKKEKSIIEKQLKELIKVKTEVYFELIQQVLSGLFPNFMKRSASCREPQEWEQRISQEPRYGTSYFTRYTLGCVPSKEIPDQPTLRYIRDINKNSFQKKKFEQKYLNSFEKLTNDFNSFVQFSGLLPKKLAQEVCDCILDWMCDRQHWSVWEQEDKYVSDVMPDVKRIMNNAGQLEFTRDLRNLPPTSEETTKLNVWAEDKLKELVTKDIIVASAYARYVAKDILGEREAEILLGTTLKEIFFSNEYAIWEKAEGCRNYLRWILGVLEYNEDYDSIRKQVTGSVLKKAENDKSGKFAESLVISLVIYQYPAGKPDLIDRYEFGVNKEGNKKTYDIDMLLPLIAKWKERKFEDPVAAKAYEYLLKEYAKELDGISPIAN